jgi:multiple sugar transport system permease protein
MPTSSTEHLSPEGRPAEQAEEPLQAGGKFRTAIWEIRHQPQTRRNLRNGLLFTSPWIIGLIVLQAYPALATFYYSFTNFNGLQFPPKWVGLANYDTMIHDPYVKLATSNTLWWVAISVPLTMVVGLLLAQLLNQRVRFLGVFRSIIYVPSMVPLAGAAIIFAWIFNPAGGPINVLMKWVHLGQPNWFLDPTLAKPTLLLVAIWQVGPTMIIFLAGLQGVPKELYEASDLDGTGRWTRFRYVTLPLLTPAIFFNLILNLIWAFSIFTQAIFVSASAASVTSASGVGASLGGSQNSLLFYGVYLYQVLFQNFEFGYASALATALTVAVALLTLLLFKSAKRWVFYYE